MGSTLRLSPKPVMALELGTHPKLTQIAEALVYVRGYGGWPPAYGSCLGVGEKALLRHTKPVFLFTLCLPKEICLKRLNSLNL